MLAGHVGDEVTSVMMKLRVILQMMMTMISMIPWRSPPGAARPPQAQRTHSGGGGGGGGGDGGGGGGDGGGYDVSPCSAGAAPPQHTEWCVPGAPTHSTDLGCGLFDLFQGTMQLFRLS